MSRFMRIVLFFDLPTTTAANRREYSKFRKYLIESGYLMMQQSVYSKLCLNTTAERFAINRLHANKPQGGIVQVLTVTERQFSRIENIIGEDNSDLVSSDESIIIL